MKRLLFALILVSISIAQYVEAPVDEVIAENGLLHETLSGRYNASIASNGTLEATFYNLAQTVSVTKPLDVSISLEILGPDLMLDGMTYPHPGLRILFSRGEELAPLMSRPGFTPGPASCDYDFFHPLPGSEMGIPMDQRASMCDFEPPDGDYCKEYVIDKYVDYSSANLTFTFRNTTVEAPFDSAAVSVPQEILILMEDASGADELIIDVRGNATVVYQFFDGRGFDCESPVEFNVSLPLDISANASFPVAGTRKLFFQKSPLLSEQWFRNNRFDIIVLSQAPLRYYSVGMDGNESFNATLRSFYINTTESGLMGIFSNLTNDSGAVEFKNLTNPAPLDVSDRSYAFIYMVNHSYPGLGVHNLSIEVEDSFGGISVHSANLSSRMLSYQGAYLENGSAIDQSISRGSLVPHQDSLLGPITISFGILALLLLLAYLNVWLKE